MFKQILAGFFWRIGYETCGSGFPVLLFLAIFIGIPLGVIFGAIAIFEHLMTLDYLSLLPIIGIGVIIIVAIIAAMSNGHHRQEQEQEQEEYDPWIELSARLRNVLARIGCEPTLEGALSYSPEDLRRIPGMGKKGIDELQAWISYQLELREQLGQELPEKPAWARKEEPQPEPEPEPEQEEPQEQEYNALTVAHAFEVFDLTEEATNQDICATYTRLIKRIHPDLGGSTYFTKQLNAAKNVLDDVRDLKLHPMR
jgi:hypothetical protein